MLTTCEKHLQTDKRQLDHKFRHLPYPIPVRVEEHGVGLTVEKICKLLDEELFELFHGCVVIGCAVERHLTDLV